LCGVILGVLSGEKNEIGVERAAAGIGVSMVDIAKMPGTLQETGDKRRM